MNFFNKIFSATTLIGDSLLSIATLATKKLRLPIIITPLVLIIISIVAFKKMLILSVFLFFVAMFILNSDEILVSVRGFLGTGFLYWFILSMILVSFSLELINEFKDTIVILALSCSIICISWLFYSLIANNKVATLANEILSAFFGVIVVLKDFIVSMIPDNIIDISDEIPYSATQIVEIEFNLTFALPLIINIITLVLCSIKGYWIEKYNNNNDVGI